MAERPMMRNPLVMGSESQSSQPPIPPDAVSEYRAFEQDRNAARAAAARGLLQGPALGLPASDHTVFGVVDRPDGAGEAEGQAEDDDDVNEEAALDEEPRNLLAQMLPEEFRDADPAVFFPQFAKGQRLRFQRLFGPVKKESQPQIWPKARPGTSAAAEAKETKEEAKEEEEAEVYDEEELLLRPGPSAVRRAHPEAKAEAAAEGRESAHAWRHGPAAYWYDLAGVPQDGQGFDYGLKLAKPDAPVWPPPSRHPPEHFLPVHTDAWEDKVVYDGALIKDQIIARLKTGEQPYCGWIPTQHTRTYETFMAALKGGLFPVLLGDNPPSADEAQAMIQEALHRVSFVREPTARASIFPPPKPDLSATDWESRIIWDTEAMPRIPTPPVLELTTEDCPRLWGMPEDKATEGSASAGKDKDKDQQSTRKSQLILGQVERRKREEEEEERVETAKASSLDPFNLSLDELYAPKAAPRQLTSGVTGASLQHSIPAQNIQRPFFPTHLNAFRLRHFYRCPLRKDRGSLSKQTALGPVGVASLRREVAAKAKEREAKRAEMGGGEVFFMRRAIDLSAKDGELVLLEFSEEHPPLMSQPGMASKIRNYYKRKAGKDGGGVEWEYGETAFTHTSPFLGALAPGQALQALENNLYKAPAYRHHAPPSDFLLIRNRKGYFLRQIPAVFAVGQECPLHEVPSPNSKRAGTFVRDFMLAFIYRLFWNSQPSNSEKARTARMEDVQNAFPHYPDTSIRKRLKHCAEFQRDGGGPRAEHGVWVLRSDFRLPSWEEVEALVTPEMCCAHYSMLIAEQRLKDAGYGEKYFFTPENEDADDPVSMEDEIKCAPWNTTRAYIAAVKGKCFLDQTGIADPTGHNLAFSYVKVSNKPPKPPKEEKEPGPKRLVTGTDADLRKLPLKEAKEMLRKFGLREDEISPLSRWEIIDVIRTLSTKQAKASSDYSGIGKFARGNIRLNTSELADAYKADCQTRFDAQNRRLASEEVLSTDEGSSDDGQDSELDEMEAGLHDILAGKKRAQDSEAKEKEELAALLKSKPSASAASSADAAGPSTSSAAPAKSSQAQKLKIYRKVRHRDGTETTKVEEISRPQLIDAYVKLRQTKDDAFIRVFAQMDAHHKEEKKKERRKQAEILRKQRKGPPGRPYSALSHSPKLSTSEESQPSSSVSSAPRGRPPKVPKPPPPPKPHLAKMKCSACGGNGHMKTNKHCPLYGKPGGGGSSASSSLAEVGPRDGGQAEDAEEAGLVQVDGTKLRFNKAFVDALEEKKKTSLKLTISKSILSEGGSGSGRGRQGSVSAKEEDEIPVLPSKNTQRRRADPKILMASILEKVLGELREVRGAQHFLEPVNARLVPDYHSIVKEPMDLRTMKEKVQGPVYLTRADFLADVQLILNNSRLYNGDANPITSVARDLVELSARRLTEKEEKLMRLEKAINPLLDDNDLVAFTFILQQAVDKGKAVPKSFAFHHPVDARKIKNYYAKVSQPMDLGTMELKLKKQAYTSAEPFRRDLAQIVENSVLFNGLASIFTVKAKEIQAAVEEFLESESETLVGLERSIQRALDAAETESLVTGLSSVPGSVPGSVRDDSELADVSDLAGMLQEDEAAEPRPADDSRLTDPSAPPSRTDETRESLGAGLAGETDTSHDPDDLDHHLVDVSAEAGPEPPEGGADESGQGPSGEVGEVAEEGEAEEGEYDELEELMEGMEQSGQLHADLALSDSDDDDPSLPKKARLEDNLLDDL